MQVECLQLREGYLLDTLDGLFASSMHAVHFEQDQLLQPPLENIREDKFELGLALVFGTYI